MACSGWKTRSAGQVGRGLQPTLSVSIESVALCFPPESLLALSEQPFPSGWKDNAANGSRLGRYFKMRDTTFAVFAGKQNGGFDGTYLSVSMTVTG
jgi:hypothetical protein